MRLIDADALMRTLGGVRIASGMEGQINADFIVAWIVCKKG